MVDFGLESLSLSLRNFGQVSNVMENFENNSFEMYGNLVLQRWILGLET